MAHSRVRDEIGVRQQPHGLAKHVEVRQRIRLAREQQDRQPQLRPVGGAIGPELGFPRAVERIAQQE